MGLIDDIKSNAIENGTKIQSSDAAQIEKLFNSLFYAKKDMEEEVKFVKQMFTRGGDTTDRRGLHTSAVIVGEDKFCYREQVLSLLYEQAQGENVPQNLIRIFEEGNAIHEKWQRLFIRGGLCKAEDLDYSRFYDQYEIGYTPDAILTIDGKKYVVEIKSVNTYQFQKMTSHPTATKQVNMYMHFTGIHRGIVLCDDKNTQNFKVFMVKYNPDVVAPYIERLEAIQYYKGRVLNENKMVKRCEKCTSKVCKRAITCAMRDACWNVGKGRVRLDG